MYIVNYIFYIKLYVYYMHTHTYTLQGSSAAILSFLTQILQSSLDFGYFVASFQIK